MDVQLLLFFNWRKVFIMFFSTLFSAKKHHGVYGIVCSFYKNNMITSCDNDNRFLLNNKNPIKMKSQNRQNFSFS